MSSRAAWSTELVPEKTPKPNGETLSQKAKTKQKKKKKKEKKTKTFLLPLNLNQNILIEFKD